MKALKQHFNCNNNCFAEFEDQQTVVVYSNRKEKCWKLNANHLYIYRIYCNPLKGQPNPFNIFIGKASDLVGFKNDDIHSKTHEGCLYDIVEITKLPYVKDGNPMEIIKLLQKYIPNLSHRTKDYRLILKSMRDIIRNKIPSGKTSIFHWLMTIKQTYNIPKFDFKVYSVDFNYAPLRRKYADAVYDVTIEYLKGDEELTGKIVGILYASCVVPLRKLEEYSTTDKEGLYNAIEDIKGKITVNNLN